MAELFSILQEVRIKQNLRFRRNEISPKLFNFMEENNDKETEALRT